MQIETLYRTVHRMCLDSRTLRYTVDSHNLVKTNTG